MNCPRNGKGRSPARAPSTRANGSPRRMAVQADRTRSTPSVRSIARAQRLVDNAALLALDLAAVAAESGRAHHARAALAMLESAHFGWIAAEALVTDGVLQ